ncbi:uncharacterized protein PAC_06397 [Phialocephala subalpina]|uniref:DUF1680 domain protein n=1 Tax=Phialocephala subalpina TaxID=576137 RepID=A0A1L7WUR4_9HELO|nr:uncharacterized protein PAC_06397 [Phialocephala subalpina]
MRLVIEVLLSAIIVLAQGKAVPDDTVSSYQNGSKLVQPVYSTLSLGSIKPLGWFKDQLELEAAGLGGNMFDFYRFVHDARWIGGSTEYSALDEASPYWFNGLVPLAFGLGDTRIKSQVKYYLDYVLNHQQSDGWLGFETTRATRGLWARCLLLLGMIQYAEADPTETNRIVDAMHRYVILAHSMLQNNYTGLIVHGNDTFDTAGFGVGRTHEMHIPLQWLYEKYPRNNSQVIWETMELMIAGGVSWGADWRDFWVEGVYPTVLYDSTPYNLSWVFIHGVNMAEGLRYPLSIYRMTDDEALKTQTRTAVDLLAKYHRSIAGTIIADEYISDLNPSRGAELCIAAEVMFSSAYIYQYLGDNDIADWTEQTAFNALPVSVSPDWWSHQYIQQENQPCCTVNHPQAYPKFLANSVVGTADGGLAHVFLIATDVATTLDNDNAVFISVNTTYPFGLSLTYTISAASAFPFYVRIPTWAESTSTISGPKSGPATLVSPSDQGLQKVNIPAGESTTFTIQLETQPRVLTRANNTAAVYYGALLYSLAITFNSSETAPRNYRTEAVLDNSTIDEHCHDHIITPTSPWNIAIDPSQISVVYANDMNELPNPIWELGAPPVELRIAAVEIEWPTAFDTAADPPVDVKVTGTPFSARFVPYGSAKLHMAHLPVIALPTVDLVE